MRTHTVADNDRLSDIVARYRVPVEAVLDANRHKPRTTLPSGQTVFASLAAGEELVVPESYPAPGADRAYLGWPWSDCPPSGGVPNKFTPGCTPTSSDPNTEDPLGRWYLLGGRLGIHAEERDVMVNAVKTRAWVCDKPCWTGDTCDCAATGICEQGGACGSLTASIPAGDTQAPPGSPPSSVTLPPDGSPPDAEPSATPTNTLTAGSGVSYSGMAVAGIVVLSGIVGAAAGAFFMHSSMRPDGSHAWEGARR